MTGFIQAEITGEQLVEAMCEDPTFGVEVLFEIAKGMNKGLLLDQTCDALSVDVDKMAFITNQFEMLVQFSRARHDINT